MNKVANRYRMGLWSGRTLRNLRPLDGRSMPTPSTRSLPHNFFDDALPFKCDGVYCKLIPLTQGQFALVWLEDYERLAAYKWAVFLNRRNGVFYAWRSSPSSAGEHFTILMHRDILGLAKGDRRQGDHAFRITLDNRRKIGEKDNLRIASASQNQWNKGRQKNNSTGFKGVTFDARYGKHLAQLHMNGKHLHFGTFDSAQEAFVAVQREASASRGEFASFD